MKKTEFQKYAYSEVSKLFLKLFMQGKANKYSSEATRNRQKIKYEFEYQRTLFVYFYRSGTIHIYQRGDFEQRHECCYYEWKETSDHKDVVAALVKDLTEFIKRLNSPFASDVLSESWGHDSFCDFAYETSKFKKALADPSASQQP